MEFMRRVLHGIAVGLGWWIIAAYAAVPTLMYMQWHPDANLSALLMGTTVGEAAFVGFLYQGVRISWQKWPTAHTRFSGLMMGLGYGVAYYNAMPYMYMAVWHNESDVAAWTNAPLVLSALICVAAGISWEFRRPWTAYLTALAPAE